MTRNDLKKLVAIAEVMGWLNSDVQFETEDLDEQQSGRGCDQAEDMG